MKNNLTQFLKERLYEEYNPINKLEKIKGPKKKPSDIKKLKDKSIEKNVKFIDGDIYDLSGNNRYTEKVSYYRGEGNGYIYDKSGNLYDVETNQWSSDTGRFAGGTINWQTTIYNIGGSGVDAVISGWSAIFSEGEGDRSIIGDIEKGVYLEDYLAKHWRKKGGKYKVIDELSAQGDANALSFSDIRSHNALSATDEFFQRYIILPQAMRFEIKSDGLKIDSLFHMDYHKEKRRSIKRNDSNQSEIERLDSIIANKLDNLKDSVILPKIDNILSNILQTSNISQYAGIFGTLYCSDLEKYDEKNIAYDTKLNKLVIIDGRRVVSNSPKFKISDYLVMHRNLASNKTLELFKKTSQAFLKLQRGQQAKYIDDNFDRFKRESRVWMSDTAAKKLAKEEYKAMLKRSDFETGEKEMKFSWELIKDYLDGDLAELATTVSSDDNNDNQKGIEFILSKYSRKKIEEAITKMHAWAEGKRKQNIKAMSDEKLAMNYAVCKSEDLKNEANILKDELIARGLM